MKLLNSVLVGTLTKILIMVGSVIAVFILFWPGDMCGNQIHSIYLSPDKKLKAVVFARDCGATTGFTTQISIVRSDSGLRNKGGNIYVIGGHPDKVAPNVSWSDNKRLFIHRALDGYEFKAEPSLGWFNTVKITYDDKKS